MSVKRVHVTPMRYDAAKAAELREIVGPEAAAGILAASENDYVVGGGTVFRCVIGEIPGPKMLHTCAMTFQIMGEHGDDVWYSAYTQTPVRASLSAEMPCPLHRLTDEVIGRDFGGEHAKFVGTRDVSEMLSHTLGSAFQAHTVAFGDATSSSAILADIKMTAIFGEDNVTVEVLSSAESERFVYNNGKDSKNPVDQLQWMKFNSSLQVRTMVTCSKRLRLAGGGSRPTGPK